MAAIIPSTKRQGDLKLVDTDPEVTPSGSGDRFTVRFTMKGVHPVDLQNVLSRRLRSRERSRPAAKADTCSPRARSIRPVGLRQP